jgi:TolA-binding protein
MNTKPKISLITGLLVWWTIGAGCAPAYRFSTKITGGKPVDEFQQGELAYQQEQYDQAFDYYDSFIQQHPQDERTPQAYVRLGEILINQKKYAQAQQLLKQFLTQYPDSPQEAEALKQLGLGFYRQPCKICWINIPSRALMRSISRLPNPSSS